MFIFVANFLVRSIIYPANLKFDSNGATPSDFSLDLVIFRLI